jgi:hypothetical protein
LSLLRKAAIVAASSGAWLLASSADGFATEAASFGNFVPGSTTGATIAAAPPPGLYLTNTTFYVPMASGTGNFSCGAGCKTRYNAAGDSPTLTWGSGWQFLGATYYPTIQISAYQVAATSTPYPAGGGFGQSPVYGFDINQQIANIYFNPVNFSWDLGRGLFVAAGLGFVAPTGNSYGGSPLPDYWTIRPHAAVSYLGEGYNLTASFIYDINTASRGNTGLYQLIARNPATSPALVTLLDTVNPGAGYTSGDNLYLDWTATKKFGKWEVGPVGFVRYQVTDDSPGGRNPATGSAWTCAQLTAAKLPSCGKDVNLGAGLLIGYDFGPIDVKFIYTNSFYNQDTVGANTGSMFFLKSSFRLWAPDESAKTALVTK